MPVPYNILPCLETLNRLFYYDNKTGILSWKNISSKYSPIKLNGKQVGSRNAKGYWRVLIGGKLYAVHRVVYYIKHKQDPLQLEIDHFDGNPSNNRIRNLRLSTRAQNQHNAVLRKDNKSGVKGVIWHKQHQKWYARIRKNNRVLNLGLYVHLEDAERAIEEARQNLHGEFTNHG